MWRCELCYPQVRFFVMLSGMQFYEVGFRVF